MRRELDSWQLQLSPYCVKQIESMIANGIQRMRSNNTIERPAYVLEAERNLGALIRYFSEYAKKMNTFPELTDSAFDAAVRTSPTIWPFTASG